MRCADGCGAPGAEIVHWRTADGFLGGCSGCSCAAVWRSGEVEKSGGMEVGIFTQVAMVIGVGEG